MQHLGPRYAAHFQAKDLIRFLTYEAVTSLNLYLFNLSSGHRSTVAPSSTLSRLIKSGAGIAEDAFLFSILPRGYACKEAEESASSENYVQNGVSGSSMTRPARIKVIGDVHVVTQESLDLTLWKIGGASVVLRFIEIASVRALESLVRILLIFKIRLLMNYHGRWLYALKVRVHAGKCQKIWNVFVSREPYLFSLVDIHGIGAYEILGRILKEKASLINVTAFETFFEFLGLNSKTPECVPTSHLRTTLIIAQSLSYR